jgi:hypothetical protein
MGSMLSSKLLDVVSENERLNRQLHGLHTSAAALRQAIADARSLQMHLQQEAADARVVPLTICRFCHVRNRKAHMQCMSIMQLSYAAVHLPSIHV